MYKQARLLNFVFSLLIDTFCNGPLPFYFKDVIGLARVVLF
jgi:hypothetical protein